jgi:hypothetical protein
MVGKCATSSGTRSRRNDDVHRRKNAPPWVDGADLRGAKELEPLIERAFAAAGVAARR